MISDHPRVKYGSLLWERVGARALESVPGAVATGCASVGDEIEGDLPESPTRLWRQELVRDLLCSGSATLMRGKSATCRRALSKLLWSMTANEVGDPKENVRDAPSLPVPVLTSSTKPSSPALLPMGAGRSI